MYVTSDRMGNLPEWQQRVAVNAIDVIDLLIPDEIGYYNEQSSISLAGLVGERPTSQLHCQQVTP